MTAAPPLAASRERQGVWSPGMPVPRCIPLSAGVPFAGGSAAMLMRRITFILALLLASSVMPVSVYAGCRKACDERIEECVATTGKKKRKCRKQVLRACHQQGIAYCTPVVATFCCVDSCPSGACVIRQRCTAPLGESCCVGTEKGLLIEQGTCEEYLPVCLVNSCE